MKKNHVSQHPTPVHDLSAMDLQHFRLGTPTNFVVSEQQLARSLSLHSKQGVTLS